jgi:hypothetical protein
MSQDFKPHPVLVNYEASPDGVVRNRRLKKPVGFLNNHGYLRFGAGKKIYYVHRIVYECHNGLIEDGFVIDHINGDITDNSVLNLQAISQRENIKKGKIKNRSNAANSVKSFDTVTNDERVFPSMNAAAKHFDICESSVRFVAKNITSTAISKLTGHRIKFSYINDDDSFQDKSTIVQTA